MVVFASVAFPLPGRYITRMFFDVVVFAFVLNLNIVFYGRCFTRMFSE